MSKLPRYYIGNDALGAYTGLAIADDAWEDHTQIVLASDVDALEARVEELEQKIVALDLCPRCPGELDTGWECNSCGFDAKAIHDALMDKERQSVPPTNLGDAPPVPERNIDPHSRLQRYAEASKAYQRTITAKYDEIVKLEEKLTNADALIEQLRDLLAYIKTAAALPEQGDWCVLKYTQVLERRILEALSLTPTTAGERQRVLEETRRLSLSKLAAYRAWTEDGYLKDPEPVYKVMMLVNAAWSQHLDATMTPEERGSKSK